MCSHGHFDHTAGIDGLIRAVGRMNMPVLLHPHFWQRRRVVLPGREPRELPTTSRRALTEAGFDIIEEREPSFLFGRSVLITGEVARTTGYEPGFPPQQAWLDGRWQPDPLVLDDQALIVNVRDRGLMVITGCGHAVVVNIASYARRPAALRAARRLPPGRPAVRAADPAGTRRPGRAESRRARARPLHRLARPARDIGPVPRRLHPERGRH